MLDDGGRLVGLIVCVLDVVRGGAVLACIVVDAVVGVIVGVDVSVEESVGAHLFAHLVMVGAL